MTALYWHFPIFPGRHQPSIFGTTELNFRVRDGNGWTLSVIDTNYLIYLSHGFSPCYYLFGDPWGNRTPVTGVRGRCLNRLTNGPYLARGTGLPAFFWCTIRGSTPGLKICRRHISFTAFSRRARFFLLTQLKKMCVQKFLVHHQGLEPGTP